MLAEANYGGRVTDKHDRRCIVTILVSIINKKTLKDGFKLDASGNFSIPDVNADIALFRQNIASINEEFEDTELYGIHLNGDISSAKLVTERLMADALSVQPRTLSGESKT